MRANTQVQLMLDFIKKALTPRKGGLDDWAELIYEASDGISLAPCDQPEDGQVVNWQVVARGVWRMSGGQQMERPPGVTKEMTDQLSRALSDMDADMLAPATASKLIQVGLYSEVRYP